MKRLENDQVHLYYEEDTDTLIGIEFLDKSATVIDLNKVKDVNVLRRIALEATVNWPYEDVTAPHIILPRGITVIEQHTFLRTNIEEITWPDKCHVIPKECFQHSSISKLHNIDHVVLVDDGAFLNCKHLTHFDWPAMASCTDIPYRCFMYCENLAEINNIDNVVDIGEEAFHMCGLKTFKWPKRVKNISAKCFQCSAIEEIHGIENVEEIGFRAFAQCNIKRFIWPPKCHNISDWCFGGCHKLSEIAGLEHISTIGSYAFQESGLKRLDLSKSACFLIDEFAFKNSKIEEFVPGYYTVVKAGAFLETALENVFEGKGGRNE